MYDIISIGGATQDIFFISDSFSAPSGQLCLDWGEKLLTEDLFIDVGGGAANSAVGFARLGLKTAFWGKVGSDIPGKTIVKRFEDEKVSLEFLDVDTISKTSLSAILVGQTGEHTIVMYRGHNDDLISDVKNYQLLTQTTWFYLSDLGGHTELLTQKILEMIEKNKIKLAFIPGQHHLKLGLSSLSNVFKVTDVLILNVYEAYTLLKGHFPGQDSKYCTRNDRDVKEMLEEFYALGVKIPVITRDTCGTNAFDGKTHFYCPAPNVPKVIDTTGAGDSFSTGFIYGILKEKEIKTCLSYGSKNAASVIAHYGAQYGLLKDLN